MHKLSLVAKARETLKAELASAQASATASGVEMQEVMSEVVKVSELLNMAGSLFLLANPRDQEQIARSVFSELRCPKIPWISAFKKDWNPLLIESQPLVHSRGGSQNFVSIGQL